MSEVKEVKEVKERILVSDFVNRYNKLESEQLKNKYVKEHIKTTYAPLLSKMQILNMMNEKSVVDDGDVKYIDMCTSKLNLNMAILVLYTNITPDKKENEDGTTTPLTWDAYDKLKSNGLLEKIIEYIGEDIGELLSVQKDILDTWYLKNKSTEAYVNDLVETASRKFGVVAGVGMEKLADVLSDEKKMDKIMSALDKMLKKIK